LIDTLECELYIIYYILSVVSSRTSVISTLTRLVSACRVRFPTPNTHRRVNFTRMRDIMTITSVISTRSRVSLTCIRVNMTLTSVISIRRV
jgi:hypothetical protein